MLCRSKRTITRYQTTYGREAACTPTFFPARADKFLCACLHARVGSFLAALVAFAATPRDNVGQIITTVIVCNFHTWSNVLDRAHDDPVAYRVGFGVGPARMICVASEVLSGWFHQSSNGC